VHLDVEKQLNDLKFDEFGNPKSSDFLSMNGSEILNYTLDRIPNLVYEVIQKNGLEIDGIDLHVYHQPNKYIATLQRKKLKIPEEKYYCFLRMLGIQFHQLSLSL
jgi:3-oxoacyl-[acyl-carrier-protein] synthase-3